MFSAQSISETLVEMSMTPDNKKESRSATVPLMEFPTYDATVHGVPPLAGDYVRFATVALALQRITSEAVPGALAEVGVYRGDMSWFIRRMIADRLFYLFDTFSGFPEMDLGNKTDTRFRDTSVEHVLRQDRGDDTCDRQARIRPGDAQRT